MTEPLEHPDQRTVSRRQVFSRAAKVAGLLAAAGHPQYLWAFTKNAFEAKTVAEAVRQLGGAALTESRDVTLTVPEVADNPAAVAVTVACASAQVRQLLVLVDKNPTALAARFVLTDAMEPRVATRIKMAESANVYGVALLADGRAWFALKPVQVSQSGCGA